MTTEAAYSEDCSLSSRADAAIPWIAADYKSCSVKAADCPASDEMTPTCWVSRDHREKYKAARFLRSLTCCVQINGSLGENPKPMFLLQSKVYILLNERAWEENEKMKAFFFWPTMPWIEKSKGLLPFCQKRVKSEWITEWLWWLISSNKSLCFGKCLCGAT